ncbi:ExbD/TolR family protein [Hirschia baltica]|uniref:Biopolymer transport protein ExbD/TolR n=1 Tax=Hirschia baltica (strain ATCC 49814 / DSM 5838 / IFAM 1418) TaxID=582402 RepID=C6XI77_HIRBI|nr:biopolymer transporter ExbD [Hirschia baltica]ACT58903.1 Biopolymer transport protein ExbD/TolR [Hirschia baltica ATCC 49814]
MARESRIAPEEDAEVDLTPMLDVVFILLIFFIVTATFVKTPGATVEKIDLKKVAPINSPIMVALTADDEIWINRKAVKMREVYATMQEMVEDNSSGEAMILVDGQSTTGVLLELQSNMMTAGVKSINISTEPQS